MKKIFDKKIFIGIIIGTSLCSGVTTYALTNYNSNQILYKKGNDNVALSTELDNLNSYINYGDASASDIANGKTAIVNGKKITGTHSTAGAVLIGTYSNVKTVNISSVYSNYSNITADNIIVEVTGTSATSNLTTYHDDINIYGNSSASGNLTITKSYDATNGILTLTLGGGVSVKVGSGNKTSGTCNTSFTGVSCKVYVVE